MRATTINYAAIAKMPEAEQGKALAQAISFELQKPQLVQDMLGGQAALHTGHVKTLDQLRGQAVAPAPVTLERAKAYLARKWTVPGDTPVLESVAGQVQDWYHTNMPSIDTAYEALFDYIDLRTSSQDHFSINSTQFGVTYKQLRPGEQVKIRRAVTEDELIVRYLEIGDGVGILLDWLRFQQWWRIDEVIAELRANFYATKARHHYQLFTAMGSGINVSFATDDVSTFNAAVAGLVRGVEGVGSNPGVYVMVPPEQAGRIQRMLMSVVGSPIVASGTMGQPIAFTVRGVIMSTEIPANSAGYYLVLPGRKLKRADWQDLTVRSAHDIYTNAEDWVARGKYNAAIGDAAQVRRVMFA